MRLAFDLHMHSCLSPCGGAENTPADLAAMCALAGLDVVALTDHNSSGNCPALLQVAEGTGLTVVPGMELCTAEEAHVVCLFPSLEAAMSFSAAVALTLPPVNNRPDIFGEQLLMDADDEIVGQQDILLTTASSISVEEVLPLARSFGGTAFPAHIDRDSYSVTAALGDIPPVGFQAVEITARGDVPALVARYPEAAGKPLLLNSDAHYLHQLGDPSAWLDLPDKSAAAVVAALDGRIACPWGRSAAP